MQNINRYFHIVFFESLTKEDQVIEFIIPFFRLSVMDETKVGNNAVIGETSIPLKTLSTRPVQQFRRILDLKSNVSGEG